VELTAISWNLFHGRDFPPDPALFTWRSLLLRVTERNATHAQVNRELRDEFARVLAEAEWDVALLQECPPRWRDPLAAACDAEAHRVLTSRNSLGPLRAFAAQLNPDLIRAGEGGSNLTLIRSPLRRSLSRRSEAKSQRSVEASLRCALSVDSEGKEQRSERVIERRELTIHAGRPERRAMAFMRIVIPGDDGDADGRSELCVANLHATNDRPKLATEDVLRAAEAAAEWAGNAPLLFGGDLNLRPGESPEIFDVLRERFGLAAPTGPQAIDHLLVRGLDTVVPPHQWPPERREVCDPSEDGLALRLSDHAPVEARFAHSTSR
jgi:endonuclease/exonuclease/phosphatase family metal-dependent hydrolase